MPTQTFPQYQLIRTYSDVQRIADDGGCLNDMWRFGILQALDLYTAVARRDGISQAQLLFDTEPELDVEPMQRAFAALVDFLAQRDHWDAPQWTQNYGTGEPWLPATRPEYDIPDRIIDEALCESPTPFRNRNIYITASDLARA